MRLKAELSEKLLRYNLFQKYEFVYPAQNIQMGDIL